MQFNSMEDLGRDKERSLFGSTTQLKLQRMKIMIIGLESVGVEVAKNILQLQPELLTICDNTMVTLQDLDYNYSVRDSDVNQINRAQACEKFLKEQFTSSTNIITFDFNINNYFEQLIKNSSGSTLPEQLQIQIDKHDIIIIADVLSRSFVVEISKRLRDNCENATNKKFNQGLIWCGTIGLYFYLYEDYGNTFKIFDKDGQQAFPYNIENISNSDPGVVRILKDRPHNYQTGNFVCIHEVDGLVEINGNQPRPIRVLSPYEFTIEDTSQSPAYVKGGLVQQAKVPFRVKYISMEEQFNLPQFDKVGFYQNDQVLIMKALTGHVTLLSIAKMLEGQLELSEVELLRGAENNFDSIIQKLSDLGQQNIDQTFKSDNTITLNFNEQSCQENEKQKWMAYKFDLKLCTNIVRDMKQKLFPLITMVGGLVALEVVKFSGKYTPLHQGPLSYEFYNQFNDIQIQQTQDNKENDRYQNQVKIFGPTINENLAKLNVLLVGLGGTGCEFLRVLAMMGVATDPDGKIILVDDDVVHKFNLKSHFWLKQYNESLNKAKTKVAQEKCWQLNQNVNFETFSAKIGGDQESLKLDYQHINLMVSSIHCNAGRKILTKKSQEYKIPLLDQSLNNVKLTTSILKDGIADDNFVDNEIQHVFDFSRDTYSNFPYLPMHSLVWAKEAFYQYFEGFAAEYENYLLDPSSFISKIKPKLINQEGTVAMLLVIGKLVLEENSLNLQNLITLAKEIFEFNFTIRIKRFLTKYPPDLKVDGENFWVGYKKAPQQILFDLNNESHIIFVQITALLYSKIFNLSSDQAFDVNYVKTVLKAAYPESKSYWNLSKEYNDQFVQQVLHKLENINHPVRYKTNLVNFEEDKTRNLYVEIIFLLTNFRSKVYQIQPMPKYKVQKYALDIHRSNPMMHTILVGQLCLQIYKLLQNQDQVKYQNLHFDMNKNIFEFT